MPHDNAGTALERIFYLGFTGVGLFFVLSGFILATVYPRLPNSRARVRFWIASLARIYPMYIVSVLLDVPRLLLFRIAKFGVMTGSAGLAFTLAAHATMLQSWWPSLGGLNFPTWSLSTEAFFYFACPFPIVPLGRVKAIVPLLFALGATWVVSLIVPLIVAPTDPSPSTFVQHLIGRNPLLRLPDFVAVIFLARLHRRPTTSAAPANACVLSASLIVAGAAAFTGALGLTNIFGFLPFHNGRLMPVYCAIILGLALSPADSFVSAVFATRLPILLGEASYSLYLLHIPLWLGFTAFVPSPNMPQYAVYFALLVSVAALKFIELPLRVRILTWYDARSAR